MLTTASITASATSAILSGPRRLRRRGERQRDRGRGDQRASAGRRKRARGERSGRPWASILQRIEACCVDSAPARGCGARASGRMHALGGRTLGGNAAASVGRRMERPCATVPHPRTSQTSTTPTTRRGDPDEPQRRRRAVSSTCAIACFAAAGKGREQQPLDREHEAERDDEIRHAPTGQAPLARRRAGARRGAGCGGGCAALPSLARLAGRIDEVAEEVANPAAAPCGCRCAAARPRRPASSGRRRRSPGPCRRPRRRCGCAPPRPRRGSARPCDCASATMHGHVAVGRGADFLRALRALGAELGRLALTLGLHALVDRLAVLLRQVGAADAHVDHRDAERCRLAVDAARGCAPSARRARRAPRG